MSPFANAKWQEFLMEQRGRKSVASLTVISPSDVVSIPRPEPPVQLTEEQVEIWRSIVNANSADWFRPETQPLLTQYCRMVVALDRIELVIAEHEERGCDADTLSKLEGIRDKRSRNLQALARAMRMTQQSTYSAKKSKPALTLPKPWEQR